MCCFFLHSSYSFPTLLQICWNSTRKFCDYQVKAEKSIAETQVAILKLRGRRRAVPSAPQQHGPTAPRRRARPGQLPPPHRLHHGRCQPSHFAAPVSPCIYLFKCLHIALSVLQFPGVLFRDLGLCQILRERKKPTNPPKTQR